MRLRPTEVKAVAALLDEEHDDVTALARSVIRLVDDMRSKRQFYCIIMHDIGVGLQVFGPYETRDAARKDIGTHVLASRDGARADVFWLRHGSEEADQDEV